MNLITYDSRMSIYDSYDIIHRMYQILVHILIGGRYDRIIVLFVGHL